MIASLTLFPNPPVPRPVFFIGLSQWKGNLESENMNAEENKKAKDFVPQPAPAWSGRFPSEDVPPLHFLTDAQPSALSLTFPSSSKSSADYLLLRIDLLLCYPY